MPDNLVSLLDDLRRRVELLEQQAATAAGGDSDIANWVAQRCVFRAGERTTSADLYDDYAFWCRENEITPLPPTSARFSRALQAYGLKRWRNSSGRGFVGIELIEC